MILPLCCVDQSYLSTHWPKSNQNRLSFVHFCKKIVRIELDKILNRKIEKTYKDT